MTQYWCPPQGSSTSASSSSHTATVKESDYNKCCRRLLSTSQETGGWEAELRRYLNDSSPNITKNMDLIEWWQVCAALLVMYYTDDFSESSDRVPDTRAYRARHPSHPHLVGIMQMFVLSRQTHCHRPLSLSGR
jgi:hypothetical protein